MRAGRTTLAVEVPDIDFSSGAQQVVKVKVEVDEDKVSNTLDLVVLPSLDPEPGTGPFTEEEAEEEEEDDPPSARPNAGDAIPSPSPR
jgi:hypothetical protein